MDKLNMKWLNDTPNFYFRYKRDLLESMIEGTCLNVGCGSHIIENAVNIDEGLPCLPYEDGSFDTVICSDVLEHLVTHSDAVEELFRVARKKVIITVPAYQWLYGEYDRLLGHHRRYHARDFEGFETKYLFWFLVPVLFARKIFRMEHRPLPKLVDNVFFRLSGIRLNFGTTLLAVKNKKSVPVSDRARFKTDGQMAVCKICHNTCGNRSFTAREMMFGYRDEFEYLECPACGCLQIKEVPSDLSKYYPADYYSFSKKKVKKLKPLKACIKNKRAEYYFNDGFDPFGKLLLALYRPPLLFHWLKKGGAKPHSAILDAGCGAGGTLLKLKSEGFSNLVGIDPFIGGDIRYENGVTVFKRSLADMEGPFDLIMMHHSFEHMDEPLAVMKELYRLLRPGGHALVRIPVASSFAWREYGVNWVQLDAPRHLFLHTEKSMKILAREAGFEVRDIEYDSTDFQFTGSEQYLKDVPLMGKDEGKKPVFPRAQVRAFSKKASELNAAADGDSACFYLYKN